MNANIFPGSWSRTAAGCPRMFRCGNGVFLDGAFSFLALKQRTSESNHHKFGDLTNKHSGLIQNSGDGLWPKGRYRSWSQLQWKNRSGPPIHRKHSFYSGFKKQPAGASRSIFYPNKLKGSILRVHDQPFVGWYHWSPTGTTSLKEGPWPGEDQRARVFLPILDRWVEDRQLGATGTMGTDQSSWLLVKP